MAYKGDFPECNRCTSFQCETCGLDKGILKIKGLVSEANWLIKINIIEIVLTFLFLDKDGRIWHIFFYASSIISLSIYRALKEQNSQAEVDKFFFVALAFMATPLICMIAF